MSVRHQASDHITNPCHVNGMQTSHPGLVIVGGKEIRNRRANRPGYADRLSSRQAQAATADPNNRAIHYGPTHVAGPGHREGMQNRSVGEWRTPRYGRASRYS